MKKILIVSAVVIALVAALGVAGYAYAKTQLPFLSGNIPYGTGMMGQYSGPGGGMGGWRANGGRGGGMGGWYAEGEYGPLHEYMQAAIAEEFDLSVEELQALHDDGKTLWAYAQEQGMTQEEFAEKMLAARTQALQAAVADGVITQEQADWMLERMNQMWQNGGGFGPCGGGGHFGGPGRGRGGGRWNTSPSGQGS